jgi:hypothetical protein
MHLTIFQLFTLLSPLFLLASPFELTLTNKATFPLDDSTFFFGRELIYESSSTFYLVQIYDSARSLL